MGSKADGTASDGRIVEHACMHRQMDTSAADATMSNKRGRMRVHENMEKRKQRGKQGRHDQRIAARERASATGVNTGSRQAQVRQMSERDARGGKRDRAQVNTSNTSNTINKYSGGQARLTSHVGGLPLIFAVETKATKMERGQRELTRLLLLILIKKLFKSGLK